MTTDVVAASVAAGAGDLRACVDDFARVLSGMIGCNDDLFSGFSCGEIETLTDLLIAAGHTGTAQSVMIEHCLHDDHGDSHFGLRVAWDRVQDFDQEIADLAAMYIGVRSTRLPGWTALTTQWADGDVYEALYASRTDAMTGLRTMLPYAARAGAPTDDEALPEYMRGLGATLTIDEMPTFVAASVEQLALPPAPVDAAPIEGELIEN